jgi:hypothetical protein
MSGSDSVRIHRIPRFVIAASIVAMLSLPVHAATQGELEAQVRALAEQVDLLRNELASVRAEQRKTARTPVETLAPTSIATVDRDVADAGLNWFGYGQVDYFHPSDSVSDTTATVSRFVVGFSNRFDDRTQLVTEVEVENTISSAEDPGEVEIEQVYVDRELTDALHGKVGLFLIPSGLLNETHEPTRFYGVQRNRVETAIIPTTWREGGVLVEGTTEFGLRWDIGVTTGFDLSKWDPTSEEGLESPLGSIHQELALAKASDVSGVLALNYTGIPGVRLGASIFSGDAAQGQDGFDDNRVTLWESHATWAPGKFDFAALYAQGHISDTEDINLTFAGNPTLIPESFFGWYAQGAYRLIEWNGSALLPFVRFERVNTAADYASLGTGLTPDDASDLDIVTTGISYFVANGVVLKADYQHFDGDDSSNQVNLGLGYQF